MGRFNAENKSTPESLQIRISLVKRSSSPLQLYHFYPTLRLPCFFLIRRFLVRLRVGRAVLARPALHGKAGMVSASE